jgi:hypothetical protein
MDPHLKKRVRFQETPEAGDGGAGGGGRGEKEKKKTKKSKDGRKKTDRQKDNSWRRCWEAETETARSWQKI